MPRYGDLTNRLGTGLSRTSLNAVKRKSNFRKYSSTYSGEEGWLLQRAEKGAEMLCAPQASSTLSYWLILPVSPPPSNTVRYGGSEADVRATAVESPAELLVERLPAARCLACSRWLGWSPPCLARRPLRR